MIRIGVVEDDPISRKLLLDYLTRYQEEEGEQFRVTVYEDGRDIATNYRPVFDIVLLDVQMKYMDGLAAAHAIRESDDQVVLVFITSSPQFAIRGYEVDALSYLLKPLPWFAFHQELKRSISTVRKRQGASIVLSTGTDVVRVKISDIVWVESRKHRVEVHTLTDTISLVGTMKAMESELESHYFFRSNSGYLVNLAHVIAVRDQETVMVDGSSLKISRPRLKAFMSALTSFAGVAR